MTKTDITDIKDKEGGFGRVHGEARLIFVSHD